MNPAMTGMEQEMFLKYLKNCNHYFEFGCGGSTVWACDQKNIKSITSIESIMHLQKRLNLNVQKHE